jgi:hypothetical protein
MSESRRDNTLTFPGNGTHTHIYNVVVKALCTVTKLFLSFSTTTKMEQTEKKREKNPKSKERRFVK